MTAYLALKIHELTNKEVALEDLIDPARRQWKFDGRSLKKKKDAA